MLSIAVTAEAHNETITTSFTDFTAQEVENYDESPYKGYLTLSVTNNTDVAWGDFHFYLFDIPGYDYGSYGGSDVFFVDGDCGWEKEGASNCDPTKDPGSLDSWTISNSGKNLDLFYYSNPVNSGQTVTFEVYRDNSANELPFGVGFYPTVVPEPVSSMLFIAGGAALGFRRFRWK